MLTAARLYYLTGVILAVLFALLHAFVPAEYALEALSALTGAAGGVYMGFGISSREVKKMTLQIIIGALFVAAALLGLWLSPLFFALAFFAHGAWDIVTVHPRCLNFKVAAWYMPVCVGYDFMFALYLFIWYLAI